MFVGRRQELEYLEMLYKTGDFQFVVMYGRRRVGKTAIIAEFIQDKKAIFFSAQEYDGSSALHLFSEKIYEHFGIADLPPFDNWNRAFEFITKRAEKRLVLAIDEFPYLAGANRSIPSILQNIIDHEAKHSRLFLILCGSSISFMERGILSQKSPLYGRLTSRMEIAPFNYLESAEFFPRYRLEDKAAAYGMMGGIPQYLLHINEARSLRDNIVSGVLSKASALYEEPRNLLREELRKPQVYNAIIEAVARGRTRLNDIVSKTLIPRDKCLKYIRSLMELRIIRRETPAGETEGRKSLYRLTDNFFKFWYRFVFGNHELVEQGNGGRLYDEITAPALAEYLGSSVFEGMCVEYLRRQNGSKHGVRLPFLFTGIGRWWGTDPKTRIEEEIDILAFNKKAALFCECKWTGKAAGEDVLRGLKRKSLLLSSYSSRSYAVFSKSGFTAALKRLAESEGDTMLIDLKAMYE
jgi:AAA+ ATPase superfamily predicted ATPase